jgi:long-subunit acyl-CoA synthetase (AMP-forming)
MAVSQAGMIHVPIYPTISESDYEYILNHCEPKIIIVSDKSLYAKIKSIAGRIAVFRTYIPLTIFLKQRAGGNCMNSEPTVRNI